MTVTPRSSPNTCARTFGETSTNGTRLRGNSSFASLESEGQKSQKGSNRAQAQTNQCKSTLNSDLAHRVPVELVHGMGDKFQRTTSSERACRTRTHNLDRTRNRNAINKLPPLLIQTALHLKESSAPTRGLSHNASQPASHPVWLEKIFALLHLQRFVSIEESRFEIPLEHEVPSTPLIL